ncbi:MAG: 5-(carboxyamino)imidazole ribonucleotide synthase [Nanoarchaeales archaeon]|nr:5-(carboxyamino)imidazole ribonucleotide synthase [Nanoarchaeales archaeon]
MIIGIIGGGQLCRMMGQEIERKNLNHEIIALDPTPNCPATPFIKEQIIGDYKDENKIRELAKKVDVLTFEIELANAEVLKEIENYGVVVCPSPESLYTIQDKFRQKIFLKKNGLPVPDFVQIKSREDLVNGLNQFGYPALLKATQDSYDGRGNYVIKSEEDIDIGLKLFENRPLMLDRFINFKKEISIIAARDLNGNIKTYDACENIHKDNILDITIAPAKISDEISKKADDVATKVMSVFNGAGVFGIELFVTEDDNILINEIAPRVHNSGHHTIDACNTSQFEQHIRAITGMELGDTDLISNAVMCNILGTDFEGEFDLVCDNLPSNVTVHMYDKKIAKPKRKLGHVTILAVNEIDANIIKSKIELRKRE